MKKRFVIAVVTWFDASYQRGECSIDELVPRVILESAGFLIREDADSVSIGMDYYPEDETWRHIENIPRVNIIKIRKIRSD